MSKSARISAQLLLQLQRLVKTVEDRDAPSPAVIGVLYTEAGSTRARDSPNAAHVPFTPPEKRMIRKTGRTCTGGNH